MAGIAATSAPANAGAVQVNGGTTSKSSVIDYTERIDNYQDAIRNTYYNTVTNNHYSNAEGNTTYRSVNIYNQGNDIVKKGDTRYVVKAYGVHDIFGGSGSKDAAKTYKYDNKSQALAAVGSMAVTATIAGRSGVDKDVCNAYYNDSKDTVRTSKATYGWNNNANLTGGKTSKDGAAKYTGTTTTFDRSTDSVSNSSRTELTNSTSYTTSSDSYVGTETKLTNRTDKITSVQYNMSNDAIMIGDCDNFSNSYVAQGNVEQETHKYRTDTYMNTSYYDRTYTTHNDNYYTTYGDTIITTYNYYSTHNNYVQDYVYKVDMPVSVTPIVLDLDGDGKIEASNGNYLPHSSDLSKDVVMFDFYGNGFPVACEWVGTNDGLLCRPNADGSVTGLNLFGDASGYNNGYEQLASLDKDSDGQLTGGELSGLMVWTDLNHNGVADKDEVKSVEELGITSIATTHNNFSSSYTRNGQTFKSFDWHPNIQELRKINVAH